MKERILCLLLMIMIAVPCINVYAEEAEQTADVICGTDENHILLSFVGDCSIGDATQSRDMDTSFTSTIAREGYAWPFSNLIAYTKADDMTFANLEVCLTNRARSIADKNKMYNLIAPPEYVQVLIEGSVEAVNTVNNHCFDFTFNGYKDTMSALDEAGVQHFGTINPGKEEGSDLLGIYEVKGVKIGVVGFSYPLEEEYVKKRIISRIEKLKQEEGCQIVIVSLHWGRETHMTPSSWQYGYAKDLINAGADVIWGHHAHVVQPVMFYKGKPIMFSTGNFMFGSMSEVNPATGIFQLEYEIGENGEPKFDFMRVIPCNTQRKPDYRPFELTEEAARTECLKYLIASKDVSGIFRLPAEFSSTGIVYVNEDGTLYCK